jgi:Protein of unknown function (DUF1460)
MYKLLLTTRFWGLKIFLLLSFTYVNPLFSQKNKATPPKIATKTPKKTPIKRPKSAISQSDTLSTALSNELIFDQKMALPKHEDLISDMVAVGKSFIGKPYPKAKPRHGAKGQTLLQPIEDEVLTINFRDFDCVTFVENTLALAQTRHATEPSFDTFKQRLANIRYRHGAIDYAARLHYFSDWLYENTQTGSVRVLTKDLGGVPFDKPIFYMTLKKDTFYGNMADPTTFAQIKDAEETLTQRPKFYIPKEQVYKIETQLHEGDIIGITNALEGMDMAHTGFVVWKAGRAHLMHASSDARKVIISEETLVDYLARHRLHTGIMVARLTR